jgi:hypothetical protein
MQREINVFISSPGDVEEERNRCAAIIKEVAEEVRDHLAINVLRWEDGVYSAHETFQDQISTSGIDVLVCILWSRLGTPLGAKFKREDGTSRTGTEFEYEAALAAAKTSGKPFILAYVKKKPIAYKEASARQDMAAHDAVKDFSKRHFLDAEGHFVGAHTNFMEADDFANAFKRDLRQWLVKDIRKNAPWSIEADGSPFRGLRAFDEKHAAVFFGRQTPIRMATERLRTAAEERNCAFLLIMGMSGAGKSSLIQAGLVPLFLHRFPVPGVAGWRRAIFRPGAHPDPFLGFALALTEATALPGITEGDFDTPAALAKLITDSPQALVKPVIGALNRLGRGVGHEQDTPLPEYRLLLVLDQFEEIFGLADEARQALVRVVDSLAHCGRVWIVATMRSDFYPMLQKYSDLVQLKDGGAQLDLLPPSAHEIGEIIREPCTAAGLILEESGDRSLLKELESAAFRPGSLPLLQFALESLFERRDRENNTLRLADHDEMGGIVGAIQERADQAMLSLEPDKDKRSAELEKTLSEVLRALATVDDQLNITAQTVLKDTFASGPAAKVVQALQEANLVVTDGDGRQATIRVAHEALLTAWDRARRQLEAEKANLELRKRLLRDRDLWQRKDRVPDRLIPPGQPLEEAETLLSWDAALAEQVADFVQASRGQANIALARQRRTKRVFWRSVGALGAVIVIGGLAAGYALFEAFSAASKVLADVVEEMPQIVRPVARVDTMTRLMTVTSGALGSLPSTATHFAQFKLRKAQIALSLAEMSGLASGDISHFRSYAEDAWGLLRAIYAGNEDEAEIAFALARSERLMGYVCSRNEFGSQEQRDEAEERQQARTHFETSLALSHRMLARLGPGAGALQWHALLADTYEGLGNLYTVGFRDLDAALEQYQKELDEQRLILSLIPSGDTAQTDEQRHRSMLLTDTHRHSLAWATNKIADIQAERGQTAEALKTYEEARDALLAIGEDNLYEDSRYLQDLSIILNNIGIRQSDSGDYAAAIRSLARADTLLAHLRLRDVDNVAWESIVAWTQFNRGQAMLVEAYLDRQQTAENGLSAALLELQRARDTFEDVVKRSGDNRRWRKDLGVAEAEVAAATAALAIRRGDLESGARGLQSAAVKMRDNDYGRGNWLLYATLFSEWAGDALMQSNHVDEAKAVYRDAIRVVAEQRGQNLEGTTLATVVERMRRRAEGG